MKKVSVSSNGQWKLEKAKADMPGPYAIEHDNPAHKLEGKEAIDHLKHNLKTAGNMPYKAMKMAKNPATGKDEPHIMLHRGMPDSHMPMDSKRHGNQKFEVTDSHVNHEGTGVHTANYDVANTYSGGYGGGQGESRVHSFWVPVSHIIVNASFQNTKDNSLPHGDHITVGPGKYEKISEEERNDMMSKLNPKPTAKDYLHADLFRKKLKGMDDEDHDNYSRKIMSFSPKSVKEMSAMHRNPMVHESLSDKDYHSTLKDHIKSLK